MESNEWGSMLQFVSDDIAHGTPLSLERPALVDRSALPASIAMPQVPTPPGTPDDDADQSMLVSVSTTFFPGANLDARPPDLAILSADSVFFYVNAHRLLAVSSNRFNALLPPKDTSAFSNSNSNSNTPADSADMNQDHQEQDQDEFRIIQLPEPAPVLNVLLHTIYSMSAAHFAPALPSILDTVARMPTYGLLPSAFLTPSSPLFHLLLAAAPAAPTDVYALAAAHDAHALAVPVSAHLLAYPLSALSDELAARIGPLYLKRLFFLHLGRIEALKRLLLPPPAQHASTFVCDVAEQKRITRAWALASAYLAWDARPDLSTAAIEAALCPLGERLSCDDCRRLLRERITDLVIQWSLVKKTI
ncbi:hypothetical protein DENSPDRAFT_851642 [Dentipellis sp. KUC8613]|nr:hypothetical protein DENSPDRAFT_851642 [Dentipellis sp. KUC8613]